MFGESKAKGNQLDQKGTKTEPTDDQNITTNQGWKTATARRYKTKVWDAILSIWDSILAPT